MHTLYSKMVQQPEFTLCIALHCNKLKCNCLFKCLHLESSFLYFVYFTWGYILLGLERSYSHKALSGLWTFGRITSSLILKLNESSMKNNNHINIVLFWLLFGTKRYWFRVVLKFKISRKVWHNPSIAFPILCYLLSYCQLVAEKFMSQQIIENILLCKRPTMLGIGRS